MQGLRKRLWSTTFAIATQSTGEIGGGDRGFGIGDGLRFPVKSGRGASAELGIKRMGLVHVCRCSRRCVNLDRRIGSVDEAGNSSCQGRVVFGPGANLVLGKNLILEGWIMDLENWAEPQLNIHFFVWARPVLRRVFKWAISIFFQILTRKYGFIFEI